MEANKAQAAAGNAILEKGVRVKVPSPLFLKVLFIKHIPLTMRATRYGTIIRAASDMLSIEIDYDKLAQGDTDEVNRLLSQYGKHISQIIARNIIDCWWLMWLARPLAAYMRTHCTLQQIASMLMFVHLMNNAAPFIQTITLTRTVAETTMKPKNVSPEEKGSQNIE